MQGKGIGRGTNCLYVVGIHQEQEDFQDIVIGMMQVFDFTVYALVYLGARWSYVTPYFAMNFDIIPE